MSEENVEKIGTFLIKIGAMQRWQVGDVLSVQQNGDKRLFGAIAIELGYINKNVVRRYLESKEK